MDQAPLFIKNQKDNKINKIIIVSIFSILILSILIFIDSTSTNYLKEIYYKISGRVIVEKEIFPGFVEEGKVDYDKNTSKYYAEGGFGLINEKYCLQIIPEGCKFVFIRKNILNGTIQDISNFLGKNASATIVTGSPYDNFPPTVCVYACSK